MTTDEILKRHGLTEGDYTLIGYNSEWIEEGTAILNSKWHESNYAFVIGNNKLLYLLRSIIAGGAEIIGYYPELDAYLVKRKTPNVKPEQVNGVVGRFFYDGSSLPYIG